MNAIFLLVALLCSIIGGKRTPPAGTVFFNELSIEPEFRCENVSTLKTSNDLLKSADSRSDIVVLTLSARVQENAFVAISDQDVAVVDGQGVRIKPVAISIDTEYLPTTDTATTFVG